MRTTRRVAALLAALVGCLGAVAYAAAPREPLAPVPPAGRAQPAGGLPRPSITQHPERIAASAAARFGFAARGRGLRFQCRLDGRPWSACRAPVTYSRLSPGAHAFSVRVLGAGGRHGRSARFRWQVLEPKELSILPQLAQLRPLYPGAAPQALPVTISNPNPVPIRVIRLEVAATASPPGCGSAENLVLEAAKLSSAAPLAVPAGGSVSLPASLAPAIQLRDLPTSQDACQHATFPLSFSAEARG
jgi:hypothetical protein